MSREILDFETTKETKKVSVWKNGILFGFLAILAMALQMFSQYFMPLAIEKGNMAIFRVINVIQTIVVPILFYGIIASGMIRVAIRNSLGPNLLRQVAITGFVAYQTSWLTILLSSLLLGGIGFSFSFDSIPLILAANVIIFVAAIPISHIPNTLSKLKSKRA